MIVRFCSSNKKEKDIYFLKLSFIDAIIQLLPMQPKNSLFEKNQRKIQYSVFT